MRPNFKSLTLDMQSSSQSMHFCDWLWWNYVAKYLLFTLNSWLHSDKLFAVLISTHLSSICSCWDIPKIFRPAFPLSTPWKAKFLRKVQQCWQNPVITWEVVPIDDARWREQLRHSLLWEWEVREKMLLKFICIKRLFSEWLTGLEIT